MNGIYSIGKFSKNGKEVVLQEQDNGCIFCISHAKDQDGYTRISYNGKPERLFRVLYEKNFGEIPKNMVVRHKCDNPSCCNVNHLEIGTYLDNIQDKIDRKRTGKGKPNLKIKGENNGQHRLTEKQVKEIFLSKDTCRNLAKKYNVSNVTISNMKNKKYWKDVTDLL